MKENMLNIIKSLPDQIEDSLNFAKNIKFLEDIKKIMVCAIGDDAVAGEILKQYLKDIIEVEVNRDYFIPNRVGKDTLVFIVSYTGNEEEVISAYRTGQRKNLKMVVITSGGKLEQLSSMGKTQKVILQKGLKTRNALAYMLFPMITILYNSRMIDNPSEEIKKTIISIKKTGFEERAKTLADNLVEKVPLIYTSEKMSPAAMVWKHHLNKTAKMHAFFNVFNEASYNEVAGYENINARYHVIMILDESDYQKTKNIMNETKREITQAGINVTEMVIKGDCFITKLFSSIYLGQLTSYFLALKYERDPLPEGFVERIKRGF
jgi:glucose/mannose-6-phosphate isomerase